MPDINVTADLPHAYGHSSATAELRRAPEDFQVDEELGFEPEGEGEHLWLWIEKRGINTDQLARRLVKIAGVKQSDISYAGLKDRHAFIRQWFSVHFPKCDVASAAQWQEAEWRVLRAAKARRKIRRGSLHGNRFIITLRDVRGEQQDIESRLERIAACGVPNYFGEQRFGHDNLQRAEAMARGEGRVTDRHLRGIYLSTLRSALFNAVLARRVRDDTWDRALPGEALNLDGSRSFFIADQIDEGIAARLAQGDIHPTGPLWGNGEPPCRGEALALERSVIAECPAIWKQGCADAGMEQERRPLRLMARRLIGRWRGDGALGLEFSLPAGCYATAVIREIADYDINRRAAISAE
jgi:tRNA pseudouridine13 synthase